MFICKPLQWKVSVFCAEFGVVVTAYYIFLCTAGQLVLRCGRPAGSLHAEQGWQSELSPCLLHFASSCYFCSVSFSTSCHFWSVSFSTSCHFCSVSFSTSCHFWSVSFSASFHFGSVSFSASCHFWSVSFAFSCHFWSVPFCHFMPCLIRFIHHGLLSACLSHAHPDVVW